MKTNKLHVFLTGLALAFSFSLSAQGVIGGGPANQGDYPWMTALMIDGEISCGASLIDSQWVLTANHCVTTFFAGQPTVEAVLINSLEHATPGPNSQLIEVDTIINHPNFDVFAGGSDLALIRLKQPSTITPVSRALSADISLYEATGTPAKVLGWGATDANATQSAYLKEADLVVFSIDTCLDLYSAQPTPALNGGDSVICAGYFAGTDSAGAGSGDSGGPLFINDGGVYKQIGVVSGGAGQITLANQPGVFTEVGQYETWIEETIEAVEDLRDDTLTVGISELIAQDDYKVYFSMDHLQIVSLDNQSKSNRQLMIYNSVGALIMQRQLEADISQSVAFGYLPKGMYIIHIQDLSQGTVFTRKLVR